MEDDSIYRNARRGLLCMQKDGKTWNGRSEKIEKCL
jgi:hypothetical protein